MKEKPVQVVLVQSFWGLLGSTLLTFLLAFGVHFLTVANTCYNTVEHMDLIRTIIPHTTKEGLRNECMREGFLFAKHEVIDKTLQGVRHD